MWVWAGVKFHDSSRSRHAGDAHDSCKIVGNSQPGDETEMWELSW